MPREAGDCSGFERVLGVFDYATGVFGSVIGVFDCVCVTCFCTSRAATLKWTHKGPGVAKGGDSWWVASSCQRCCLCLW